MTLTYTLLATLLSILPPDRAAELLIHAGMFQDPGDLFDFEGLGLLIAGVSFGLIGVLMAGAAFFGDQAERAKRTWLPTSIGGLVLIGIAGAIIDLLS